MTKTTNIPQGDALSLPKGYKNTPLGIIPEDWEVKRLGEISIQLSSFSFSRAQLTNLSQRLRYVHYGDIHVMSEKDCVDLSKDELPFLKDGLIDNSKIEKSDFPLLKEGDIIFADASEDYEGIGNCWEIIDTNGFEVISGLHTIPIRCNKKYVSNGFGRYIFKSRKSAVSLRVIAHGTKVYSLSFKNMSKLKIALPPLPEQQKIAEILSTWDAAIEKQNQLIQQLELRKRGLMQQLLTGKLRLRSASGERFEGEWKKVKYSDIVKEINRKMIWDDDERYELISVRRRSGGLFQRESLLGKEIKTKNLRPAYTGDFLISKMQIVHGASGLTSKEFHNMKISNSYITLIPKNDEVLNMDYFNLWSQMRRFYHQTFISSYGVHIEKMTFSLDTFLTYSMKLPPFEEQTAIAEVLSAADNQIALEKQKLDALRNQKKGLMQVLLSGKVRVV